MINTRYFFQIRNCFYSLLLASSPLCSSILEASEEPADSSNFQLEIIPNGNQSLQQISLPLEIYQNSQSYGLSDLRLLDKDGDAVPFEISAISNKTVKEHERTLDFYPLHEKRFLSPQTEQLSIFYDKDKLVNKVIKQGSEFQKTTVGYLIDLRENVLDQNKAIHNFDLIFELSTTTETSFLNFSVDQSNDLKSWRTLSNNEVLASLVNIESTLNHNQISLRNVRQKFLRIRLADQTSTIKILGISQKYTTENIKQNLLSQVMTFKPDGAGGDTRSLIASTQLYTPLTNLSFDLDTQTKIISGTLFYERYDTQSINNEEIRWYRDQKFDLYQIQNANQKLSKSEVNLNGIMAKQLRIKLEYPSVSHFENGLIATVSWPSQKLTFLNDGNTPYFLVTGLESTSVGNNSIISNLLAQVNRPLPQAFIGKASKRKKVINKIETLTDWTKIGLWAILIMGALLMGVMANKLLKQIDKQP